jgi:exopolyphosphatase/guanosine-5'-triphosphate,3'-diphosphate pyrophosphatase
VAAIDVGSNAIRFVAWEFTDASTSVELDSVRAPVRLGAAAFRTGLLDEETMERAISTLGSFRRRMDALEIRHYRAAATSAVRDSRNGRDLVKRAREEWKIHLEPISGREEARLVWLAIRRSVPLDDREWLLVDLGGGSVEVSLVDARGVRWSESHLLGTVRLLQELGEEAAGEPAQFRRVLRDHTGMLKFTGAARGVKAAGLIGTGGNIEALAELAEVGEKADGLRILSLKKLREAIDTLAGLTPSQRIEQLGLREDRADVILPAAMVYERLMDVTGIDDVIVPCVGVKEGLMLDVVDSLISGVTHEQEHERESFEGALEVGRRYAFDEPHARQVTRLALSLFDDLRELHELDDTDRRILLGAALLHDIGQFITYRQHHKHSYYLISNADLPGFSPDQVAIVALVARYHRRADPKTSHEEYAALEKDERERVVRLASILRIADALDREHIQHVEGVRASVAASELRLEIEGTGDLFPEQWALKKKSKLFRSTFDLELCAAVSDGEPS